MIFLLAVLSALATDVYTPAPQFEGGSSGEVLSSDPWWSELNEPLLDSLVVEGLKANLDLGIANTRLRQAEAGAAQTIAGVFPYVSFDMQGSTSPYEDSSYGSMIPATEADPDYYTVASAMFTASMGLDVWGAQTLAWRSMRYQAQATSGDNDALRLSVSAYVIGAALDTIQYRQREQILSRQLGTSESLLELTELRYERGDVTALDVLQQRQALAATKAQLPSAKAAVRASEHRLLLLIGRTSADPVPELPDTLPDLPVDPSTGTPEDLLVNRPDLRAALARVDASRTSKQSTVASALPSVGLQASTGWTALKLGDDTTSDETWSVAGSVSVPIFNGGRAVSAVKSARAAEDGSVLSLNKAYIGAVQEVEIALVNEQAQVDQLEAYGLQLEAASLTFTESRLRYIAGETSFLNVLNSHNGEQQAALSYLSAQRNLLGARLNLHQALGSSTWESTK